MDPADFRAARKRWGFTQATLGTLMEINAQGVYRIESGRRAPPVRYERLLRAYMAGHRPKKEWPE